MKSEFDTTGIYSSYFFMSALVMYLVPATWSRVKAVLSNPTQKSASSSSFHKLCSKKEVQKVAKKQTAFPWRSVIYVAAWVSLALVLYQVSGHVEVSERFDPYQILEIDVGSSEADIKQAYRRLSRMYHPDKFAGKEAQFVQIAKAYNTLTDEATRLNWEKYGHPDGKRAEESSFALPSWIVEGQYRWLLLAFYFLAFMVALPGFVATWWWNSRKYTGDHKVLRHTIGLYFKFLKARMTYSQFVQILGASVEFLEQTPVKPHEQEALNEIVKSLPAFNDIPELDASYCIKAKLLLAAHLQRMPVPLELKQDQATIVALSPGLVQAGMVHLLAVRAYKSATLDAMQFHQALVQGISDKGSPLLMLPHITTELLGRKSPEALGLNFDTFFQMPRDQQRLLLSELSDAQFAEMLCVADVLPTLVFDTELAVAGEERITAKAIVTLTVSIERLTFQQSIQRRREAERMQAAGEKPEQVYTKGGIRRRFLAPSKAKVPSKQVEEENFSDFEDDEWEAMQKNIKKKDGAEPVADSHPVYCPYYPGDRQEGWWILLTSPRGNQVMVPPKKIVDLKESCEVELQFQAPGQPGEFMYELNILSDCYVGCNFMRLLKFKVFDALPPPKMEEIAIEEKLQVKKQAESEVESDLESDLETDEE